MPVKSSPVCVSKPTRTGDRDFAVDINTAKGALDVAKEFNGDVQIELTGYWTWEQACSSGAMRHSAVVYHRSRDAGGRRRGRGGYYRD